MNTYKDIYKKKKTMNDINPTTGLPMSGGGIDTGGTPYGSSLDDFDDETSESGYDGFNNIANYWSWKVDAVLMLIAIGGECLFLYCPSSKSILMFLI
jgi:hypothetical protein